MYTTINMLQDTNAMAVSDTLHEANNILEQECALKIAIHIQRNLLNGSKENRSKLFKMNNYIRNQYMSA